MQKPHKYIDQESRIWSKLIASAGLENNLSDYKSKLAVYKTV